MRRFDSYVSALTVLGKGRRAGFDERVHYQRHHRQFELQFKLSWKLLKGFLQYEGSSAVSTESPREILKEAHAYFNFIDEDL